MQEGRTYVTCIITACDEMNHRCPYHAIPLLTLHSGEVTQSSSSHLEEPAGESVTKSVETGVSEEQINKGLAEELRRTKLDETQPDPQQ